MLVQSPCIRNCCLDEDDICLGCYRHVNEIMSWQKVNNTQKQQILLRAKQRKAQHKSAFS
ncbi:MAG: DUF1289 domain-containing protein [Pseudomonadota bacterium]